ncbi:MAG: methyltransferase domain-containing protein [Terriglobia bacterium]
MQRIPTTELLDEDQGTPREIAESFQDLWRINRWLGGVSGSMLLLLRFFARNGLRTARILDVGCGDARMALALREKLRRRGLAATFFVLDRRLSHLQRHPGSWREVTPIIGDAMQVPLAPGSVDVVMCNLFLHHFSGEDAKRLLRELAGVAARAVLINDLERRAVAYFISRHFRPFSRSPITRHDAPASVRQAYTLDELRSLAEDAGFRRYDLFRLPKYRLGLILWKAPEVQKS